MFLQIRYQTGQVNLAQLAKERRRGQGFGGAKRGRSFTCRLRRSRRRGE